MKPISASDAASPSKPAPSLRPRDGGEAQTKTAIKTHWKQVFRTHPAQPIAADYLFLSRLEDNNQTVDDVRHDRMIDPLMRFMVSQGYSTQKALVSRRVIEPTGTLAIDGPAFFVDANNDIDTTIEDPHALRSLFRTLGAVDSSFEGKYTEVKSLIKRTLQRELVFGCLLEQVRPKIVFLSTFDDPIQMAMILACRRRGIKTVDIQHGKQGSDHLLGVPWASLPAIGVDLLPDFFWVWGHAVQQRISASLGDGAAAHKPVCGGNLWLNEWCSGSLGGSNRTRAFSESFTGSRKRILVCLQPIADPLPPALLTTIVKSPKDWVWWIRLHPKQRTQHAHILERLEKTGASFEIEKSTSLPLFLLLQEADCHLTAWSTVAFEADALAVPTILFHEKALSFLSDEITEGRFYCSTDPEEILDLIWKVTSGGNHSPTRNLKPSILFSADLAQSALSKII